MFSGCTWTMHNVCQLCSENTLIALQPTCHTHRHSSSLLANNNIKSVFVNTLILSLSVFSLGNCVHCHICTSIISMLAVEHLGWPCEKNGKLQCSSQSNKKCINHKRIRFGYKLISAKQTCCDDCCHSSPKTKTETSMDSVESFTAGRWASDYCI